MTCMSVTSKLWYRTWCFKKKFLSLFSYLQISDCLSAQAQVKLQLLSAELTIFDLNVR